VEEHLAAAMQGGGRRGRGLVGCTRLQT
jgi:hypothetical protein